MNVVSGQLPRFFFLTRSLEYGGSERQLIALAKGLRRQGASISVVTFYSGGALRRELESAGISVRSLEKRTRWHVVGFFSRLVRLTRRLRPTLIHGYLATSNILAVLLKPFCPSAKIVWGFRASNMELERYGYVDQIQSWVERKLSRFADLIVVNSHAGFDYAAQNGFQREKMVVIPNGIDVDRFRPDPISRDRIRDTWGLSEYQYVLGLVGRLDPMKGHDTFLKAAALLAPERNDIIFLCIGDGPQAFKQSLMALSHELGLGNRLMWIGASDDVVAVYNGLDLVTSCSSYGEGFSNVIGEAMACGKVCVVTDVGDSRRIVGDTGYVVPPRNPSALVAAWQLALEAEDDERTQRGEWARDRVIEQFSLERLINETSHVLETIANTGA